jgi:hypothetical protein
MKNVWLVSSFCFILFGILFSFAYSVFDLAFVLGFVGLLVLPGYLVCSRLVPESEFSFQDRLIASIGLGMCVICLLGLSFSSLGIRIDRLSVLLSYATIDGFAVGYFLLKARFRGFRLVVSRSMRDWNIMHFFLVVAWGVGVGIRLYPVRNLVVPPYHDPAEHAFFAALIIETGTIPTSLQPYANTPLTYPPGLHLIIDFFSLSTGLPIEKLLLLLSNLFNGTIALTSYLLISKLSRSQTTGLLSALLIQFISPFPADLFFAGKNSMIAGFLLLPIAVLLTYRSLSMKPKNSRERVKYLIAAGISFSGLLIIYYTAALLYLMFVVPYALCEIIYLCSRDEFRAAKMYLSGFLIIFALGFGLSLPFISRVFGPIVDFEYGSGSRVMYLSRSIPWVSDSLVATLTNFMLMVARQYGDLITTFSLLGFLTALVTFRRREVWSMMLWFLTQIFFATPYPSMLVPVFNDLTGDIMLISFFLLLSFFSALFISELVRRLGAIQKRTRLHRRLERRLARKKDRLLKDSIQLIRVLLIVLLVLLASLSAYRTANAYGAAGNFALVKQTDYKALQWIAENTPKDAVFLNNAYVWWEKGVILGSDAGSWIPALAHRKVLFPVILDVDSESLSRYDALNATINDPDSNNTLTLLRDYNVSYVYIGPRSFLTGPALDPIKLLGAQHFRVVWQEDDVWVFELVLGRVAGQNDNYALTAQPPMTLTVQAAFTFELESAGDSQIEYCFDASISR